MNNGYYQSNKPEVVGPKVAEVIAADLGLANVPFEIELTDAPKLGAGGLFREAVSNIFGGTQTLLFTVCFDLKQPRPMTVHVRVDRYGVGSNLASALFSTTLSKPITTEAVLEDPKTFGSSKFTGDPAAIAKLNANKDLIKRAGKFARTEWLKISAPRMFKIAPQDGAAVLLAATLPRSYAMGFKVTYDVAEFAELAALVEATM
jgi:hypothetical protein